MKLISYNIQYGYGSDGRYDLARAARIVDGADIIALQEVERHWQRSNGDDQPEILSRLLPDYHWVYGPAFDMDASERRDGRVVNRRRQFGTMVLSKLPIVWSRLHALPLRRTLRPLNTRNAALECMIRAPAGAVRIFSLHLAHIGTEERLEQIDYLFAEHRRAPSDGGPWSGIDDEPQRNWSDGQPEPESPLAAIWLGDFNMEPDSAEYRRIVGSTPYHRAAAYIDGFVDAAAVASERVPDFHTHEKIIDGRLAKRRLDHCFVGGMLAGRVRSVSADIGEVASDHFPLRVDIDLETRGIASGFAGG
ncbi:MAG: EEP domain-containing protein [Mesorhizobium sp.]|uniref:endonuclease/exonuclease/phosphatase family protein n=1 Tax=Mesorhizobium sp. TaxID=1871066 RepID=UPI000FE9E590|nr:endonuclease/exonuclease/phosphatase family protein [Mesorhizobium sp.]RWM11994.1 MAG: EEP domain-containing protein [Mesorhizobium sp.]TIO54893.1 MAG: EEP domain-containing protein [Mesorhizobium sp.]TIO62733.1 MAG: EEP domain-containing protein [Mesorhizobium sp.]TJV67693.1 MAG: EEP domain-containing protein [Mesorhizobium sp.]